MTATCPYCEAEIEVRLETQAAVAPPLRLAFASVAEFALWLKASRLSVDEFRRLPVYEWHRDQLGPPTRAVAHDADHMANAEPVPDELSDAPNV